MASDIDRLIACMANAKKVEGYDFSHLNKDALSIDGQARPVRKISGSLMTRKKTIPGVEQENYTFDL